MPESGKPLVIPVRFIPADGKDQEYEYRAVLDAADGHGYLTVPRDAPDAAREYRAARAALPSHGAGSSAELQRRPVGDWETVERAQG